MLLLAGTALLLAVGGLSWWLSEGRAAPAQDVVTAVIPDDVKPGYWPQFERLLNKVHKVIENSPGFVGFEQPHR